MGFQRVISLVPAATEIMFALRSEGILVGRSHECDFPPAARDIPQCTAPAIDANASSQEIHDQVSARLQEGLPVFTLDLKQIQRLKPDLIIVQDQCSACSVPLDQVKSFLQEHGQSEVELFTMNPARMTELWDTLRTLANLLGKQTEGQSLLRNLKNRCVDVIEKTCLMTRRPLVGCVEWLDPLMVAGHWVPDLVQLAGGTPALTKPGERSRTVSWDELAAADPDVLLLIPCGFTIERTLRSLSAIAMRPEWSRLKAVKKKRVYLADGSGYFNRPGPRLIDSLESMAEMLYPDIFRFGHRDTIWIPI